MSAKVISKIFGSALRAEFPIFAHSQQLKGKPLSFLDSAASSQKPSVVIKRLSDYLSYEHANVHRGAYDLSAKATDAYEAARATCAAFIGAKSPDSIIFTKGTTESINLAAFSLQDYLAEGDSIILTLLEHHSNIVPWQILSKRKKLSLLFSDVNQDGSIDLKKYRELLKLHKPKIVAFTMLANALGTVTPFVEMAQIAKEAGALVLLDAAQYAAHGDLNVQDLQCDFLAFSAHKLYGPTGTGILYASDKALSLMQPVFGGGNMISIVTTEKSEWADAPHKFEGGTPAIAEIIGMATALVYLDKLKKNGLAEFETKVFERFLEDLRKENGLELYGPASNPSSKAKQSSIITFNVNGVHPHDFATVADEFNVQIRAGHHCAQPLLNRLGLQSTARISLAAYSDIDQVAPLIEAIRYARKVFT